VQGCAFRAREALGFPGAVAEPLAVSTQPDRLALAVLAEATPRWWMGRQCAPDTGYNLAESLVAIRDRSGGCGCFGGGVVEVRLHGPVEVWVDNKRLAELGTPRQRAALAVDAGGPVLLQTLIDRVWDQAPPVEARSALYTHISRLRETLNQTGISAE
jgi:hypothetical protein